MEKDNTFEIGLVMAGAVSAGAYTAGVVDYLLEALQHYAKVRDRFSMEHPGEALHNVQIRVVSGASAGGMTGAILLSSMLDETYRPMSGYNPSVVTRPDIDRNIFYKCWVDASEGIDIRYLLDTEDISGNRPLKSLLNCKRIDYIADAALSHPRKLQQHDYIPERIDLFMSVFNLAGVPYTIGFQQSSENYGMVNHSDMMHFVLDTNNTTSFNSNEIPLNEDTSSTLSGNWKVLRQATLATGAFPVALEPRYISKDPASYSEWKWWVPQTDTADRCDNDGRCFALKKIAPAWSRQNDSLRSFLCVDGGVGNNEPLEIARRTLAGKDRFNPRDKNEAHRAIVMIDPFPSEPDQELQTKDVNLVQMFSYLFAGLKEQARFKPDELEAAGNPDIFSRFMIAPSRKGAPRGHEIASASLGAFGGFLSERFREHDFQLGRKNCQRFLMKHFAIGIDNHLVRNNADWFRQNGCVIRRGKEEFVQVIPMVDLPDNRITEKIVPIPYDSVSMHMDELDEIMQLIERRIKKVIKKSYLIEKLVDDLTKDINLCPVKWFAKKGLKAMKKYMASYICSRASGYIRNVIEKDLKKRKLLV